MSNSKKNQSAAPGLIIIGSIILTIAMANLMFLIVGLFFVWIFGDKL